MYQYPDVECAATGTWLTVQESASPSRPMPWMSMPTRRMVSSYAVSPTVILSGIVSKKAEPKVTVHGPVPLTAAAAAGVPDASATPVTVPRAANAAESMVTEVSPKNTFHSPASFSGAMGYCPMPLLPERENTEALLSAYEARFGFTAQQCRIFRLVARGCSNSEIAAELFLTESTVKFHMGSGAEGLDCRMGDIAVTGDVFSNGIGVDAQSLGKVTVDGSVTTGPAVGNIGVYSKSSAEVHITGDVTSVTKGVFAEGGTILVDGAVVAGGADSTGAYSRDLLSENNAQGTVTIGGSVYGLRYGVEAQEGGTVLVRADAFSTIGTTTYTSAAVYARGVGSMLLSRRDARRLFSAVFRKLNAADEAEVLRLYRAAVLEPQEIWEEEIKWQ